MISYAQNFEDVMLHRVFGDRKTGFYIDVGAMDPVIDSVTKCFYDQGWCGINVEPNEFFFSKLAVERERDINLNVALGDREESKTFYVNNETGLSTLNEQNRDVLIERGFEAERKTVQVTTLAAVCNKHVDRPIDFLKVDCEGWEKQALAGADWERFRPTVVLVEATLPGAPIPAWSEWEPILVANGRYDMVYFDGLNRFYLRCDSPGLRTHFNAPPNVFDDFKGHSTKLAEEAIHVLQQERDGFVRQVAECDGKNQRLTESLRVREAELNAQAGRITKLEQERRELGEALSKSRLWVGQLSQNLAATRRQG
jgi:FkbM family methyltransferase